MGRRSEPRINVSLPVIVRGIDSRGNAFTIHTETHDLGFTGAALKGLAEIATPGMKIEVESNSRRAWYRVEWTTSADTSREQRIGIRSLEYGKYIWGVAPKGWEPDTFELKLNGATENHEGPVSAAFRSWRDPDRREFARHACRIETVVKPEDSAVTLRGKITEISLNGCFVEMLAPLPVESQIHLSFDVDSGNAEVTGKVSMSQIGTGMGVGFTTMSAATFEKLRSFAPPVAPPADSRKGSVRAEGAEPPATAMPSATPTEAMDAVIRLLLLKGIVTPEELSEEIGRTKGHRATVSASAQFDLSE